MRWALVGADLQTGAMGRTSPAAARCPEEADTQRAVAQRVLCESHSCEIYGPLAILRKLSFASAPWSGTFSSDGLWNGLGHAERLVGLRVAVQHEDNHHTAAEQDSLDQVRIPVAAGNREQAHNPVAEDSQDLQTLAVRSLGVAAFSSHPQSLRSYYWSCGLGQKG